MAEAHIDSTINMFDTCCRAFEDYAKISSFLKFSDVIQNFEPQFDEHIQKFQSDIKLKHSKKKNLQTFCKSKMQDAERKAERDSIILIEQYKKDEKNVYREIEKKKAEQTHERINFSPYEAKLTEKIATLQIDLMDVEIKLQHALAEARRTFIAQVLAFNDDM